MSKGRLFVISGASGVGKSTVLGKVMGARNDLSFSVSATTRPPRPGEVEGKSYYFVSRDRFEEMIRQDAFLEYDEHAGNFYGTPRLQLDTSEEQIKMRLDRANWEMDQSTRYDYVVVNDQVDECARRILSIIAEKAD